MKKPISKIRRAIRRLTPKMGTINFSISAGVPPFFKVELRYTSKIEKQAANDNKRRTWRLRAKR